MPKDENSAGPIIANNAPTAVQLVQGQEYHFCACGRSGSQPFCDGSHAGTAFKPKRFVAEETATAYLCACKHTGNAPFCDGTHKRFSAADVGQSGPGPGTRARAQQPPEPVPTPEEPNVAFIHQLAREGLSKVGHHGPMTAMGVPGGLLPRWDDIQIMTAQLAKKPLMEDHEVGSSLVIGPRADKPLRLEIPLFV
ncbi:MAG TPA: CDGSH iron-sulfur domain-containing protein, partial [Myxococcota bacterium]|nr:CDGSH iron-sulfur domain-containing protein [Myxococcota bacterium]